MHRIQFIHQPPANSARSASAVLVSCAFHGVMLGLLLWLTFYYQSHLPPPSGAAPGAPTITLQKMVIVSPPPEPPQPPPATPPTVEAKVVPRLSEAGVPVLAAIPVPPVEKPPVKATKVAPPAAHQIKAAAHVQPKAAKLASFTSAATGRDEMSNPTYPAEAIDRNESGTVYLSVQFDSEGNVLGVKMTQSSGYSILDNDAKSFIRAHWHSSSMAGEVVIAPIQYKLENH